MQKIYLVIGTVLAGLAVALGAFGSHGLKKIAAAEDVAIYQTGVQYQMYHAFGLLVIGLLSMRIYNSFTSYAGVLFGAGVLLFSGSLYLLVSLHVMAKAVPKAVNLLTPLGGLLFIAGWVCLLIGILKK